MEQNNKKLECRTAKFKHSEALYFLNEMKTDKILNGSDDVFEFFFSTFVISGNSIIDYIHSDFVFHTISPLIDWQDWHKSIRVKNGLNELIENHPEKTAIQKFRRHYNQEYKKLLGNPIANYFKLQRNKISLTRLHPHPIGSFFKNYGGNKKINERYLENNSSLLMYRNNHISIPSHYFTNQISDLDKEMTLERLSSEPMLDICSEYLVVLSNFIRLFEGNNYFQ